MLVGKCVCVCVLAHLCGANGGMCVRVCACACVCVHVCVSFFVFSNSFATAVTFLFYVFA